MSKLILTAGRVMEKIKKEKKNKVVNYILPKGSVYCLVLFSAFTAVKRDAKF